MRFALLAFLILGLNASLAQAQYYALKDDSAAVRVEIPAAVVTRFRQLFPLVPKDTVVQWKTLGQTDDYSYEVSVGVQRAVFYATGVVDEAFLEVQGSTLPKPVQRRLRKSILKGWSPAGPQVLRAYSYTLGTDLWYYEICFFNPAEQERNRFLRIQPDGKFPNPKFR